MEKDFRLQALGYEGGGEYPTGREHGYPTYFSTYWGTYIGENYTHVKRYLDISRISEDKFVTSFDDRY